MQRKMKLLNSANYNVEINSWQEEMKQPC